MTIKTAMQKAMDGGWKPRIAMTSVIEPPTEEDLKVSSKEAFTYQQSKLEHIKTMMLLDPQFWQCLGKAMGWCCSNPDHSYLFGSDLYNLDSELNRLGCPECNDVQNYTKIMEKWHRMIDHLADGGRLESYFETL